MKNGFGMNWLRQEKRLALYLRDGLACAYCGNTLENGAQLTLDHVVPFSLGGSHHQSNVVTCCDLCNKSMGNRKPKLPAKTVKHIRACTQRPIWPYLQEAKQLMNGRSAAQTLGELK